MIQVSGFRFPALKPGLAEFGGLIRVHPRNQIGFFQEIAPVAAELLLRDYEFGQSEQAPS